MPVISIRKPVAPTPVAGVAADTPTTRKIVQASQKEIDALPLDSGDWKVKEIKGLFIRCRAKTKSFRIERRVNGKLIKETLGQISMKQAKQMVLNGALGGIGQKVPMGITFAQAFDRYLEQKTLSAATIKIYRTNFTEYLASWHHRALLDIGEDREGMRALHQRVRKQHGKATGNNVIRLASAVYNWQRKVDRHLPESPTQACDLDEIRARDWAFDDDQLRAWWSANEVKAGKQIARGVKTLSPLKRAYWLTSLFTGARPMSVENLRWRDINFEKRTILFMVNKGNPPYLVPMSDVMHDILTAYRDSKSVPPSEWLFPSYRAALRHVTNVKNDKQGVLAKYRLRHTFKTRLTGLGFTNEQGKMLQGHSLGGDIGTGYITAPLLVESLRPVTNALANEYLKVLKVDLAALIG